MVRDALKNMVFIAGGSYMMGNEICFDGDRKKNAEKIPNSTYVLLYQ